MPGDGLAPGGTGRHLARGFRSIRLFAEPRPRLGACDAIDWQAFRNWNIRTAAFVFGPAMPSAGPRLNPTASKRRWRSSTVVFMVMILGKCCTGALDVFRREVFQCPAMAYEWDGQRAGRAKLFKLAFVVAATMFTVGLPVGLVLVALTAG